jgi:hypothetical protein
LKMLEKSLVFAETKFRLCRNCLRRRAKHWHDGIIGRLSEPPPHPVIASAATCPPKL